MSDLLPVLISAVLASALTYFFAPLIEVRKERGRRSDEAAQNLKEGVESLRNAIEIARRNMSNQLGTYPSLGHSAPKINRETDHGVPSGATLERSDSPPEDTRVQWPDRSSDQADWNLLRWPTHGRGTDRLLRCRGG